jgi:beta-galactosidase
VSSREFINFLWCKEKWSNYPDFQSSSYDLEACSWSNVLPMKISYFGW